MVWKISVLSITLAFLLVTAGAGAADDVNDCLRVAKLEITQRTFPSSDLRAAGVIKRNAGDDGSRYLVQQVSGLFKAGDEVSAYSIHGNFIGLGKVHSVYGQEFYVDLLNSPAYAASIGDEVFWNYTREEANAAIHSKKDVFLNVAAAARMEDERIASQIATEQRRDAADRLRYQEDMTRMRLNLEAQYYANSYGYRYYPFYYP